ncbi:PREDICTED: uncharacterized protein LOC100640024 [Amphimedon queenslandica]|uniref:PH domain-containing protein n=1 Tax=Amphimedon queenslandica TaxID=400682 RepID=A0A1X7VH45_AMPQE|nr:PREDICTED: uncharacterized protein LOC100640024 [Amphimedon queenslandica]|eukprot:XP_003384245.1 PREDICTED: uncharacterized protein LOC100640024 [Amphimedon queenslandica]
MSETTTLSEYVSLKVVPRGVQATEPYRYHWVVLTVPVVPHHSTISYWSSKEAWLNRRSPQEQGIQSISLESFKLQRSSEVGDMEVIEVILNKATLLMMFESTEKCHEWDKVLQKISSRVYTEIVRSKNHPNREKQYIIEISPSVVMFYEPHKANSSSKPDFTWKIEHIKRAKYDINVGKTEVEISKSGRSGDGDKYMLIGPKMKELYFELKERFNRICGDPTGPHEALPIKKSSNPTIGSPKTQHRSVRSLSIPCVPARQPIDMEPPPLPPRPIVLSRTPVTRRSSQPVSSPSPSSSPLPERKGPPLPPRSSANLSSPLPSLDDVDEIYDFEAIPQLMVISSQVREEQPPPLPPPRSPNMATKVRPQSTSPRLLPRHEGLVYDEARDIMLPRSNSNRAQNPLDDDEEDHYYI